MEKKYSEAKEALQKSMKINVSKKNTDKSRKLLLITGLDDYYKNWKTIETENFIFHYPENTKLKNMDEFAGQHEDAFKKINAFFNNKLPKKIDFFIWDSNEQSVSAGSNSLGFAMSNLCLLHERIGQTLGHETAHVISLYPTGKFLQKRFISEGTAVYFNLNNENKLANAKSAFKRMPNEKETENIITDMWKHGNQYDENTLYPIAGAFVERLIASGGKDKFLLLI